MSQSGAFFSPKKSKSKRFCSVFGCNSTAYRDVTVRFHGFPASGEDFVEVTNKLGNLEKIDRAQASKNILRMGKTGSPNMVVCSKHFKKEDYILPGNTNLKMYVTTDHIFTLNFLFILKFKMFLPRLDV